MKTFKKKSIYAAILAGFGMVGVASTASAVYVNPNGVGQVLIYPYFTAQNGLITALSVVNSGNNAKVVKVRFREGKNSREVLDFNLYLSPYDTWTGAVTATATGAMLSTTDLSCTVPAIPASGVAFRNNAYSGTAALATGDDGSGTGLDRTREGYFEMIELGMMTNATQVAYVTHAAAGGAPANCAAVLALSGLVTVTGPNSAGAFPPSAAGSLGNDLFGGGSIINVATGLDFTFDATAFADFLGDGAPAPALSLVLGNEAPNLNDAFPAVSAILRSTATGVDSVVSDWTAGGTRDGVNAVSATIMQSTIMNEFALDASLLAGTDWVVNFPTKRYYVTSNNVAVGGSLTGAAVAPFQRSYWNGSCDDITINYYDREEYANVGGVDFSPSTASTAQLCWETNVVTFNNSNVLSSVSSRNIDVGTRQNGWASIAFRNVAGVSDSLNSTGVAPETGTVTHVYQGLPTIGFAVQKYTNSAAAPGLMATYGGNWFNKATRNVLP